MFEAGGQPISGAGGVIPDLIEKGCRPADQDPEAERKFIAESVETIQKVTGQRPIGWSAYWMRKSPHTLDILQSLGPRYHIDEPGIAEPFIVKLKEGDFGTVPYTFHMNDTQGQSSFIQWLIPKSGRTRPSNGHPHPFRARIYTALASRSSSLVRNRPQRCMSARRGPSKSDRW